MENNQITDLENKFCLIYTSGPVPFVGDAKKTYELVFLGKSGNYSEVGDVEADVESSIKSRELLVREDIKKRIDELQSEQIVSATSLRPRLTEMLLRISDECSHSVYEDKFGNKLSPAALRSVAVTAISKLTEMYGIKEDIAHKVMLEGKDGAGIVFNVIAPEPKQDSENLLE